MIKLSASKTYPVALALLGWLAACTPSQSPAANAPANIPASPAANQVKGPINGLVAYYPFEGDAQDRSGQGHHGKVSSRIAFAQGKMGQAARFVFENPTENDHIEVPHTQALSPTGALTISAWVNPGRDLAGGSFIPVATKGKAKEDYTLWLTAGGPDLLLNWDTPAEFWPHHESATQTVLAPNAWTMVTAAYDGAKVKFYLNDQAFREYPYAQPIQASGENLYIGASLPGGLEVFDGLIDELRLYNRALSATEVKALYAL